MRKTLRFLLVSLLLLLTTGISATEVTILPSDLEPVTSGDYYIEKDGVIMSVTASTVNDSQFRIFKGMTITFMGVGTQIKKIVFTCTANGTAKYGPGNFTGTGYTYEEEGNQGTWEGDASMVTLTAETAQVRATSIVVTLGEGGQVTPGPGDDDEPSSILDDFKITSGQITDNGDQLLFDFVATSQSFGSEMKGRLDFAFENNICTSCVMTVNFPNAETATAAYQQMMEENKEGQAEVSVNGNVLTVVAKDEFIGFSKIVIKSMFKMTISPEDANGYGILDNPFTACMANVLAGSLEQGETTTEDYYVKGKIADIKYTFSEQYGTATFFISRDGSNDYTFQAYSVYYLENKPWVEGNTQIKVGDEVIICGKLTNYNGTPETASKKAYIYSLNGVTKNEMGEKPEEIKSVTVAEFNAAAESSSVWYQLTGIVNNLKDNDMYGNFDLEDETGSVYVYGVLSEKGGAKRLFQELVAAKGIQNGSKLTIIGNRGSYNGKIEVTNAYFVSVDNSAAGISNSIATTETKAVVYNLRGQRVDADYKGIVIKNGRKILQR
jgi:hypothetical protein